MCQVLLFSTMTRLLDIVEEHLEWRGLVSVRLDGATAAQERGAVCLNFPVKCGNKLRLQAQGMHTHVHARGQEGQLLCSLSTGCSSGGGALQ